MSDVLLSTSGLTRDFGAFRAVDQVGLQVTEGTVHSVIGPNGAGKSTLFALITGDLRPTSGTVAFAGRDLTGRMPHTVTGAGLAKAFQTTSIFPRLRELADRRAEFLSGGEQQMVKLGRALLGSPRLLLLDEPTEGLSPAVVGDLGRWLELLRARGTTILLTEQNALFALAHADRGYILEKGRVTHTDTAEALRDSAEIRASLGVG